MIVNLLSHVNMAFKFRHIAIYLSHFLVFLLASNFFITTALVAERSWIKSLFRERLSFLHRGLQYNFLPGKTSLTNVFVMYRLVCDVSTHWMSAQFGFPTIIRVSFLLLSLYTPETDSVVRINVVGHRAPVIIKEAGFIEDGDRC